MELITAVILGIVQGVTEFLPVSSSGHTALILQMTGASYDLMQMAVFLHLGTLIALCLYLRTDLRKLLIELIRFLMEVYQNFRLWRQAGKTGEEVTYLKLIRTNYRKLMVMILAASPVTMLAGALLQRTASYVGRSGLYVGAAFFITAIVLVVAEMVQVGNVIPKEVPLWKVVLIGAVQGLAVIPGISRAAMTIAGSILAGFNRKNAVRFSYLLSIPAILGALIAELSAGLMAGTMNAAFFQGALPGMAAAGITGYLTVGFFLKRIRRIRFRILAGYCIVIGAVTIAVNFIG